MSAPAPAAREIRFLAVARRSDKVILAHRIHTLDKSYDFIANVQKVLNSPGWASVTTDKLSLDDGPNMFYVLLDVVRAPRGANADTSARCGWATLPRDAFHHHLVAGGPRVHRHHVQGLPEQIHLRLARRLDARHPRRCGARAASFTPASSDAMVECALRSAQVALRCRAAATASPPVTSGGGD